MEILKILKDLTTLGKRDVAIAHPHCPHVGYDVTKAFALVQQLSAKPSVLCLGCYKTECKKEEAEKHPLICDLCGKAASAKDMAAWSTFDYIPYHSGGKLLICSECASSPAHRERIALDAKAYARSLGISEED